MLYFPMALQFCSAKPNMGPIESRATTEDFITHRAKGRADGKESLLGCADGSACYK
jgi:hypothetical protein